MADDERRIDPTVGLIIGFVIGTLTLGIAVYFIARAMRSAMNGGGGLQGAFAGQPINIYNVTGGQGPVALPTPIQPSAIANQMQLADGTSLDTRTRTITLSTSRVTTVFKAPSKGPLWRVRLHAIGPAGGFAAFAVDSIPDISGASSAMIPAGSHTEITIGPRQVISGIAGNADTAVSYIATAEVV